MINRYTKISDAGETDHFFFETFSPSTQCPLGEQAVIIRAPCNTSLKSTFVAISLIEKKNLRA